MDKTATLNIRVNPELKKSAEKILSQLGVPMATAVDMFLKQVVLTESIPFAVALPKVQNNAGEETPPAPPSAPTPAHAPAPELVPAPHFRDLLKKGLSG